MLASDLIKALRPLAEDKSIKKIFHNENYDRNVFLNHGLEFVNTACTLVMGHNLDPNIPGSLKERSVLVGHFIRKTSTIDFSDLAAITNYASSDALATGALFSAMSSKKGELSLGDDERWFCDNLDLPVSSVVVGMERRGIRIDKKFFAETEKKMNVRLKELYADVYRVNGGPFNLKSVNELRRFLFSKLGVTPHKWTGKGEESTNAAQLHLCQHEHEAVGTILEIRKIEKLLGTYVRAESGIPFFADSQGDIHPSFNTCGTVTGRFSSSNPNAQQIPSRNDVWGIRSGFVARPGKVLIVIDYSQMELRKMGILSQDPAMIEAYSRPGTDLHHVTAERNSVSRDIAKALNFGLLYGMGAGTLSYQLTMSGNYTTQQTAEKYIRVFFRSFARLAEYPTELVEEHKKNGFIRYLSGRRRTIPTLKSKKAPPSWIAGARRELLNNQDQGSCADWVRSALLRCSRDRDLLRMGCFPILQVHDELVFEVDAKHAKEAMARCQMLMEKPTMTLRNQPPTRPLSIPLITEGAIGPNWKDAKKK